MMPWKMQENVSRIDAALRGVMPYSSLISLAMGFAITMATVLFAVAMSIAPTRRPMPIWPPRLPRNAFRIQLSSASKPPYSRISAQIAETKIATIEVSNIPAAPLPMFSSRALTARMPVCPVAPVASAMTAPDTIPMSSTIKTLIPMMPPMSTST